MTELDRYVRAIALGEICDRLFRAECRRVGIDPHVALSAPMTWLAINTTAKATVQ